MSLTSKQILAVLCRFAYAVLALCVSIWTHTDHDENAPGINNINYLDGLGGFWMIASILFIASVALEMSIVSAKMTRASGGFILYLIGAMLLFISSIWFFAVPRMLNDYKIPPKDVMQGFILASGLVTFIAQVIIALQYRVSGIQDSSTFVIASSVGAFASLMIFLGGVFWLQDVIINGIMSFEPDSYYNFLEEYVEHVEAINNRISICLILGSVSFILNAFILASAFSSMSDKSTEAEQEETAIPAEVTDVSTKVNDFLEHHQS